MDSRLGFDAVVLWDASNKNFDNSDFNRKLLYVTITGPLHNLHIFYRGEIAAPLRGFISID